MHRLAELSGRTCHVRCEVLHERTRQASCAVPLCGSPAHAVPLCRDTFALTPGTTVPWVWKLATSSLMETDPLLLLLHICACLVVVPPLELHSGAHELLKLTGCCAVASGVACFLVQYLLFFALRSAGAALFTPRYTFAGVMGGLVVAVTRCLPAEQDWLDASKLPAAYLAAFAAVAALTGTLGLLPMALAGTATGWAYVRYFGATSAQGAPLSPL